MIGKLERANGYYEIIEMFADGGNVGQIKSIIKKQYGFELHFDCGREHDDKIWKTELDVLLYEHGAENIQEINVCFDEEQKEVIGKMRRGLRTQKENQLKNYLDHDFFYENDLRIRIDHLFKLRPVGEQDVSIKFPAIDLNENTGHEFDFSKSCFLEEFKVPGCLNTGWIDDVWIKEKNQGAGSPFVHLLCGYYKHKFNEIGGEKMFECFKLMCEIEILNDFPPCYYDGNADISYNFIFIEMMLFVLRENKFETTENMFDILNSCNKNRRLKYAFRERNTEIIKEILLFYKETKTLIYDLKKEVEEHLQKEKKEKENERNELDNYQIPRNYRIIKNGSRFIVQDKDTLLWILDLWGDIGVFYTENEAKKFIKTEASKKNNP